MIKRLILYFQFFTQIPIPIGVDNPTEKMRTGVKYFSFFGFLVGIIESLVFFMSAQVMSLSISWLVVLFVDVVLTGGFHLDAVADMADGLFSSRKKERMLEIMKDSRVGSNGVLILIFYYLISFVTFFEISPTLDIKTGIYLVIAFNLIGKMGISLLFYKMKYSGSNPNGLGTVFVGVKLMDVVIAQIFGLIVLYLMFGYRGLVSWLVGSLFVLVYKRFVYKKIDGLNGDTLGAASPLSQIVFMLLVSWMLKG